MPLLDKINRLKPQNKFILFLAVYFLLHLLVRVAISDSVEFDEAEQILFSQQLSLGYGSQPPLYEWLQKAVFTVFGLNIFSLALLKNFLFCVTYFFIFKSARVILKEDFPAILSSGALLLTHTYGWQSMRQLTHLVLAVAICAVTFYVFLKLGEKKELKYYLLLGLFAGLGLLAKYNYAVFIFSLVLGGLSIKQWRRPLVYKKILLTLFLALALVTPFFIWFASHPKLATLRLREMQMDASKVKGIFDLALCLLSLLGPLSLIFLIFFPRTFTRNKAWNGREYQFKLLLERFFLISLAVNLIWVLSLKNVDFEERWLQPLFFLFPTYLFLRLKNKPVSAARLKFFGGLVLFSAVMILIMIPACAVFPGTFGYKRIHYPFKKLSREIRSAGFDRGLVLSPDTSVAADIKLQFKDSLVLTHRTHFTPRQSFDKILLIWGDTWWYDVPRELQEILPRHEIKADRTDTVKKALYKYSKDKYYKVYLMIIDRK